MTIFATDFDSGTRFVVEIAIAVRILTEVTVNAVHALVEMNII